MYTGISAADRTRGLQDERRVVQWLATKYTVRAATREEQIHDDIDVWILNPKTNQYCPVSIKSQVAGLKYKNIGLEVLTMQYTGGWSEELAATLVTINAACKGELDRIVKDTFYHPAWLLFGKAEKYMILLGDKLLVITKADLMQHIMTYGFDYCRSLSKEILEGQGGKNAISGYIYWDSLKVHGTAHQCLWLKQQ